MTRPWRLGFALLRFLSLGELRLTFDARQNTASAETHLVAQVGELLLDATRPIPLVFALRVPILTAQRSIKVGNGVDIVQVSRVDLTLFLFRLSEAPVVLSSDGESAPASVN